MGVSMCMKGFQITNAMNATISNISYIAALGLDFHLFILLQYIQHKI